MANNSGWQDLFDGVRARMQRERARTQLTLGGLIDELEQRGTELVAGLGSPHSFRGHYDDLAFEPADPMPACDAREKEILKAAGARAERERIAALLRNL